MLKAKDLEDLIGQKVADPKAQKIIAKIPVPGKRKKDDNFYHLYEAYGLEFIEDAGSGRVMGIYMYAKQRRFAQYGGELPKKLDWSMTQEEVRGILGDPDQENGPEEDQWHYGKFRLGVERFQRRRAGPALGAASGVALAGIGAPRGAIYT